MSIIHDCDDCRTNTGGCSKHSGTTVIPATTIIPTSPTLEPVNFPYMPFSPLLSVGGSGWQCPKCGACYAPWVFSCPPCSTPSVTISFVSVPEQPAAPNKGI